MLSKDLNNKYKKIFGHKSNKYIKLIEKERAK